MPSIKACMCICVCVWKREREIALKRFREKRESSRLGNCTCFSGMIFWFKHRSSYLGVKKGV